MMRISKPYSAGFSLVELMVAVSIGTIVSLSMASLIADLSKGNAQMRANMDYVNFAQEVKAAVSATNVTCDQMMPGVQFTGGAAAPIPNFVPNPQNPNYRFTARFDGTEGDPNFHILGTNLQLERMELLPAPNPPTDVSIEDPVAGQQIFRKYSTKLRIVAKKRNTGANDNSSTAMRPIELPITVFTPQASSTVRLCSANDAASACQQMGGVFVAANPNIVPPTPERCDILPAFGGCAKGGSFSFNNTVSNCTAANPYTGSCSCPANFTPYTVARFPATKDSTFEQRECLQCSDNRAPMSVDNTALTPIIDDELEDAVDCAAQNAQYSGACQICQQYPANDIKCLCAQGATDPRCSDPCHADMYGPSSYECVTAQWQACNGNISTPECLAAAQQYGMYGMCGGTWGGAWGGICP